MKQKMKTEPKSVSLEYIRGAEYKASIGEKGLFEQSKVNERFYVGNQWYGCKAGNDRPLVRRNIIEKIGQYKMSVIASSPVTVNYSADGIPCTFDIRERGSELREEMINGILPQGEPEEAEITTITGALSDYFRTTAERLKFEDLKEEILRNAYISGTGVIFTYWDEDIETGLYADESKQQPIRGDIAAEVIDIENIVFGDPNNTDVQKQPYIIIAQRREVEEVKRAARRNGLSDEDIKPDRGDLEYYSSGDRGDDEPHDSKRVTVYTKLYKEYDKTDKKYRVMAVRCTEKTYVRKPWDLKLKNYPICIYRWKTRRSSIYGESEITYLIPNQIAINRALTASVWSLMLSGMPIMLVNGDVVPGTITNEPGQIIKVYGGELDVSRAIHYVQPPNTSTQFQNMVSGLCSDTINDSGAAETSLAEKRPDNAAAIIQLREAAQQPMQLHMNHFYSLIEDVARVWADFWINMYGNRLLKTEDRNGVNYIPFDSKRYKSLLLTARVDVGSGTVYSAAATIATLDNMLSAGLIDKLQYFERLPSGIVPDITGLINDFKEQQQAQGGLSNEELIAVLEQQYPEQYETFMKLSAEQQAQMLAELRGELGGGEVTQAEAVGDM